MNRLDSFVPTTLPLQAHNTPARLYLCCLPFVFFSLVVAVFDVHTHMWIYMIDKIVWRRNRKQRDFREPHERGTESHWREPQRWFSTVILHVLMLCFFSLLAVRVEERERRKEEKYVYIKYKANNIIVKSMCYSCVLLSCVVYRSPASLFFAFTTLFCAVYIFP